MAKVLQARLTHREFLKWCGLATVGAGAAGVGDLVMPPKVAFADHIDTNGNLIVNGKIGVATASPFGKLDVLARQGGTSGSAVATLSHQLVLGGPYNAEPNINGVKLWIGDYDNDGSTVYPIYVEDENNYVDFYLRNSLSQGGTPLMYFRGDVGIGTTGPDKKLHVAGDVRVDENLMVNIGYPYSPAGWARGHGGLIIAGSQSSDGSSGWRYGGRIMEVDYGDGLNMEVDVLANGIWTNNALAVSGRSGREGRVGVGTTGPGSLLDVNGTANLRGIPGGAALYVDPSGRIGIGHLSPAYRFHIWDGGTNGYTGFGIEPGSSPAAPMDMFVNKDTNFRISMVNQDSGRGLQGIDLRVASWGQPNGYLKLLGNMLQFCETGYADQVGAAGTPRLTIANGGNVGIGITSPAKKLHVVGDVQIDGNLTATGITGVTAVYAP